MHVTENITFVNQMQVTADWKRAKLLLKGCVLFLQINMSFIVMTDIRAHF